MGIFDFGTIPLIQQELRRFFASAAQGTLADSALQPDDIGESVQARGASLDALAALTGTGGVKKTGTNSFVVYPLTAFGESLAAAADAAAGRTALALTIGSNVQAWDTDLDGLAGLSTTGILERTGSGTFTTTSQLGTSKIADAAITEAKLATVVAQKLVPAGTVLQGSWSAAPAGFLKANGAIVSRTTYADLFAAIGTTYGSGDGSTTFSLPDFRGEFLRSLDDGRGVDALRVLGSAQVATSVTTGGINSTSDGIFTRPEVEVSNGDSATASAGNRLLINNSSATAETFSYTLRTVRPRNVALLTVIKF